MLSIEAISLLDHLGYTGPIQGLVKGGIIRRLLGLSRFDNNYRGLRHDIDHDTGVALDMAIYEEKIGLRATYYFLHTHAYNNQPNFIDRLIQIQDLGHEVGVHLDALGSWYRHETNSPIEDLERWLDTVRKAGINVIGSAAHGSRSCYQGGFANHWIWEEESFNIPSLINGCYNAEGRPESDPKFQIKYNPNNEIIRADGKTFGLWSCSLKQLGLWYEASSIDTDFYWSDSGGSWTRSDDPRGSNLRNGTHQILIHPWWWQKPIGSSLILSTARSGSKWLSQKLQSKCSASVYHELSLNQENTSVVFAKGLKRTSGDLVGLLSEKNTTKQLLRKSFAGYKSKKKNVIEANVYLAHICPEYILPYAEFIIHLHRDPALVIRSILQRGWYQTPEDHRHPKFDVPGWDSMSTFEKCCTYWAETNRLIHENYPNSIKVALESLAGDDRKINKLLQELGFSIHKTDKLTNIKNTMAVDPTTNWFVPSIENWSINDIDTYLSICTPVASLLGRDIQIKKGSKSTPQSSFQRSQFSLIYASKSSSLNSLNDLKGLTKYCEWEYDQIQEDVVTCRSTQVSQKAWFALRIGCSWTKGNTSRNKKVAKDSKSRLCITGTYKGSVNTCDWIGRLFIAGINEEGNVIVRKPLLRLDSERMYGSFSVTLHEECIDSYPIVFADYAASAWEINTLELTWNTYSIE